jgi:tetratricopeptide (TPR) repeat protein
MVRVCVAIATLFYLQTPDFSAEGTKALDEGRYEAAAQAFGKAIEADPQDYFAHFNLALAYAFLHKDAEGIAEYRKTLELKPALYEAELNLGIMLMKQKEPAEAVPLFEDAAGQKPDRFQPRFSLAEAQLQSGAPDKAEENYRQALRLDPQSAAAEAGLAHALARQEKLADAAPHFQQAAKLDPRYRSLLLELGELYENHQQPAEAITIYREFPDNAAAQQHLGRLMLENKQYADALPQLEAAYQRDASQSNRTALAAAYVFTGDLVKALPLLSEAVAAAPADYELRMMYARALRDNKKFAESATQFYEAAKLKPNEPKTWSQLGGMLYMTNDYPRALAAFDKARELGEDTAGNWFLHAIILDRLKQLKPAVEAYQRFLALSQGKNPDQEFQARQRVRIITREIERR